MTVTRAVVVVAAFTTSLDGAVGGPSVMLRLSTLRVCARARVRTRWIRLAQQRASERGELRLGRARRASRVRERLLLIDARRSRWPQQKVRFLRLKTRFFWFPPNSLSAACEPRPR